MKIIGDILNSIYKSVMAFYDFGFHFIVLPVKYASYLDKSVTLRNDGLIKICH